MNIETLAPRSSSTRSGSASKSRAKNPAAAGSAQIPAQKINEARPASSGGNGNGSNGTNTTPGANTNQNNLKPEAGSPSGGVQEHSDTRGNETQKEVVFLLDLKLAKEVLLVGDFTDWQKHPVKLLLGGGGTWHTKVKLSPGRHLYRYLVDGQWHDDPKQTHRVPNDFGTFDHVIEVS